MSRFGTIGNQLYRGEVSYDFVERRKLWYTVSAVLLAVSIAALVWKGLTLGIEFRGGAEFRVKSPTVTTEAVRDEVASVVEGEILVQGVGTDAVRAQTERLTSGELQEVQAALADRFEVNRDAVSTQFIGPSWGAEISTKALRALFFFLLGLVVFLSLYFEWKMALAAILALVHDLVITVGIYALIGFEVTPATVIGFLTILGYSLYDTVVVFDKVRENTQGLTGGSRMTYSQSANLALNQTLVRSINTSIVALLPIGAILFAGVVLLGAGPLKDLSLALFIGVATGAYSSIFIATPLLASMKEREPAMQALAKRVALRRSGGGGTGPTAVRAKRRPASRTTAPAEPPADQEPVTDADEPVPASTGATAFRPQDRRPPATGGTGARSRPRQQPRKGGGNRNRSGGKKRR